MGYKVKSYKGIADQLNNRLYTDYYYRLKLMARSVFEWEGLPEGMKEEYIERFLFSDGKCIFFNDKTKGYMVLRCTEDSELNYYDEPTYVRPHAIGYTGERLENGKECVVIKNNDDMLPTYPTIQMYAARLTSVCRTADVNINAHKTPYFIVCDEKQLVTMKAIFNKINSNEPAIFGDSKMNPNDIKVLKTDAPVVFDKLRQEKHDIWNEAMTFLGINNANMDKRERLVDDEVQANNEQIEQSAQIMLKAREQACREINKIFGLNISVKLRKRAEITVEEPGAEPGTEGGKASMDDGKGAE